MPYDFSTWDRNCSEEQPSSVQGSVTGTIPSWLRGTLLLNGPGKMKYGQDEFQHVFDGSAILQKIKFSETGPEYSSRFLRSSAYLVNTESNSIAVSEFGTKASATGKNALQKLGNKFSFDKIFTDNAQINIVRYGGHTYAISETPFLHRFNEDTLETENKIDLHKDQGMSSQCPHPIYLKDGSAINILSDISATGPRYNIVTFPPHFPKDTFPKPTKLASVDARWKLNPCHVHSFGLSDNYVAVPEQPMTMDVKTMMANTVKDKPFIDGMEWVKNKLVKIHLVCRSTGKEIKQRYKCETFFYLHIVNCFEQDKYFVMDVCTFQKPDLLYSFFLKNLREKKDTLWSELDQGVVKRIVLPLEVDDKASPEQNLVNISGCAATAHRQKDGVVLLKAATLTPSGYENPVINPSFVGKQYSYFFGASSDMSGSSGKVGKVDTRNGEVKLWSQPDTYACVLAFVPHPGATGEDEGALLVVCLQGGDKKNQFSVAILDPSSMAELATVNFTTPSEAPRAYHGIYVPEQ